MTMSEERKREEKQVFAMLKGTCLVAVAIMLLFMGPALFPNDSATLILGISILLFLIGFVTLCSALYDLRLNIFGKLRRFKEKEKESI